MTRNRSSSRLLLSPEEERRVRWLRLLSLAGSVIVALSSGSIYAFSSFAPQLQEQLQLTSTQINVVGVAGNVGVYLSGPLWGRWVDKKGPRGALIVGAVLVFLGYGGLSACYSGRIPSASPLFLAFLSLLAGLGNSGSFSSAMNAQAKSWGGTRRGSATALVLSGFGLSAFMYSTLSHTFFPGQTAEYLLLLALGSAGSFLFGLAVIRIYTPLEPPLAEVADGADRSEADEEDNARGVADGEDLHRRPKRYTRRRTSSDVASRAYSSLGVDDEDAAATSDDEGRPHRRRSDEEARLLSDDPAATKPGSKDSAIDITGWKLIRDADFLILFVIMALISGTGLLVINNIGTITRTLWEWNRTHKPAAHMKGFVGKMAAMALGGRGVIPQPEAHVASAASTMKHLSTPPATGNIGALVEVFSNADKAEVAQLQAHQVSAISLGNASGRIAVGLLSDLLVNTTGSPRLRVWLLVPVCLLAVSSQALAAAPNTITTVRSLLAVSSLTGFMYGTLFGICPVLTFEWFGLKHFSQNWGIISLSPVLAGNVFNLLFGRVYDSHVGKDSPRHQCLEGEECYRVVFEVTELCAIIATLLAGVLIIRRAGRPQWLEAMLGGR